METSLFIFRICLSGPPCYCPQVMKRKDPSPGQKKAHVMEQLSGVLDCVLDRTARNRGEREAVEGSGRGLI